jgi:hypothetical protein
VAEAIFRTLKTEAEFGVPLSVIHYAQRDLFAWVEITYGRRRRQSRLHQLTIPEFKKITLNFKQVAQA